MGKRVFMNICESCHGYTTDEEMTECPVCGGELAFKPIDVKDKAKYKNLDASDNKSCLDVYNISKEDGANICQWEYWGGNGQKFILEPVKEIEGDVNADGALSVTDAVLLQKWLLAVPDAKLTDWKAADLCEDNIINVLDLHLMKRMLLEQ